MYLHLALATALTKIQKIKKKKKNRLALHLAFHAVDRSCNHSKIYPKPNPSQPPAQCTGLFFAAGGNKICVFISFAVFGLYLSLVQALMRIISF